LTQMRQSMNQRKFLSSVFEINRLEWQIEAYPNGYRSNMSDVGSFQIFLKLIKIPYDIDWMGNELVIFSPQVKSSYSRISQYNDGTSKGWADYCLGLNEIKRDRKLEKLTFTIQLQILRINNQFARTVDDKIIYQSPIYFPSTIKHQQFKWKIDGLLMSKMQGAYPGKQFESAIFNKMWCLNVAPNGAAKKWKDYFDVFLVLCGLPQGVQQVDVIWMIKCDKLDLNTRRRYNFGYEKRNCNDCWTSDDNDKKLSFQEFKMYNQVEIILDIEIRGIRGNYGNDIAEKEWDRYLDPKLTGMDGKHVERAVSVDEAENDRLNKVMDNMGEGAYGISGNWS